MQGKFGKLRNDFESFCKKNNTNGLYTSEYKIRMTFDAVSKMKMERHSAIAKKADEVLQKMIQDFKGKVERKLND